MRDDRTTEKRFERVSVRSGVAGIQCDHPFHVRSEQRDDFEMNARDLERLVPGSKAVEKAGQLIWTPPRGGHKLSGKKQKGKGDQAEGQESLFTVDRAFWFRGTKASPWYFEDNKDGIKFRAPNWRLSWCHFRFIGEDAVTSMDEDGMLEHCTFQGKAGSDKCLQLNFANRVTVDNCRFWRFITAIQCGLEKYSKPYHNSVVSNCKFDDVECAIKAVKGKVEEFGNEYKDGDCELIEVAGGKIKRR